MTTFTERRPSTGWGEGNSSSRQSSRERISIDMGQPSEHDIVPFGFVEDSQSNQSDLQKSKKKAKRTRVRKLDVTDVVRSGLADPAVAATRKASQPRLVERSGQPRRRGSRMNSDSDGGNSNNEYFEERHDRQQREARGRSRHTTMSDSDASEEDEQPRRSHRSRSNERDSDGDSRHHTERRRDYDSARHTSRSRSPPPQQQQREARRQQHNHHHHKSSSSSSSATSHNSNDRRARRGAPAHDPFDRHEQRTNNSNRPPRHDPFDRHDGHHNNERGYRRNSRSSSRSPDDDRRERHTHEQHTTATRSRIASEMEHTQHEAVVADASRTIQIVTGKAAPQSPEQASSAVQTQESSRFTPPNITEVVAPAPVEHPVTPEPEPEPEPAVAASRAERRVDTPPLHKGAALEEEDVGHIPQPTSDDPLYFDAADQEELKAFVSNAAPELAGTLRCEIRRDKKGMGKGSHPVYYLHVERPNVKDPSKTDKVFLLAGRKRKKCKTSNYLISSDPADLSRDSDSYLAKLRANFVGTHFTIFDNGENLKTKKMAEGKDYRKELGAVIYEKNVLGYKGPRKMQVVIPAMDSKQEAMEFKPLRESDTMQERIKLDRMDDLIGMENKQPEWAEKSQTYELKFGGRVTMASVKNFQVVHPKQPDYVVLQFGRIGEHQFTMDYQYPMSALQAFSICLSSLDGKWACE